MNCSIRLFMVLLNQKIEINVWCWITIDLSFNSLTSLEMKLAYKGMNESHCFKQLLRQKLNDFYKSWQIKLMVTKGGEDENGKGEGEHYDEKFWDWQRTWNWIWVFIWLKWLHFKSKMYKQLFTEREEKFTWNRKKRLIL